MGTRRGARVSRAPGGVAQLTGHLGLLDWSWEPTVLCGLVALVVAYVLLWRRGVLRGSDDVSPWFRSARSRPVCFAAGMLVAFLALQSPIDRGGDEYLFSVHMLQHLMLMMVAPPLLLLGIAGAQSPPSGRYARVRRAWWFVTRPWVALVLFNVVMLVWHIPALYNTTLTALPVHIVEHLSFMAVGILFWWTIVEPVRSAATRLVSPLTKIAVLVVSGIPPTVLGLIFALSPAAFYDFYIHAPRLWGISPVFDQQIGGVLMLGLGNIIYFVAIVIVFVRLLGDSARDEEEAAAHLAGALRPGH
ncbi:MAG: cytochrome c oxidase assembly protein [Candidatus Dormibacteraeota bacterium]|nr:cytochrome c oxidase assembly protein [Candidatus Dormibacteraeota bacterium]MBV9526246.1 cytochrome c oxidase assembly protein [Candidatus Dormibacteraeota bacterium]